MKSWENFSLRITFKADFRFSQKKKFNYIKIYRRRFVTEKIRRLVLVLFNVIEIGIYRKAIFRQIRFPTQQDLFFRHAVWAVELIVKKMLFQFHIRDFLFSGICVGGEWNNLLSYSFCLLLAVIRLIWFNSANPCWYQSQLTKGLVLFE